MSSVAVSGSRGFLGWHTRVRARALTGNTPVPLFLGEGYNPQDCVSGVSRADHVIHIAGVNRGTDQQIRDGNIVAAERLAAALRAAPTRPAMVTFANSIQVTNGSAYGEAKKAAGNIIADACSKLAIDFRNVLLPNLFGESGVPFYNSVVATFCHLAAQGKELTVNDDKELTLLHAQKAAAILLDTEGTGSVGVADGAHVRTVVEIRNLIQSFAKTYRNGDIPGLPDRFAVELFNTYRSFAFDLQATIPLIQRTDDRGSLTETVRVQGGESHTFFSTTKPGITRGQHHHLRKIERFVVLSGTAEITLRKVLTDEVRTLSVSGNEDRKSVV